MPALVSLELFGLGQGTADIQYTYIFLGLAAGCVGVDKFFGFSTAWMRMVTTAMAMQKDLAEFEMEWARLNSQVAGNPSDTQIQNLLDALQDFLLTVHARLQEETKAWVDEFETNLSRLQKDIESQLAAGKKARTKSVAG